MYVCNYLNINTALFSEVYFLTLNSYLILIYITDNEVNKKIRVNYFF